VSGNRAVAVCLALALGSAAGVGAQVTPTQPATLAGVVRDSAGAPLSDVEVVFRDAARGVRTNARGEFVLADVLPGAHRIWFRRLGYNSVEYDWAARFGVRTEVTVTLHVIPQRLDPVVVRADEDRRMKTSSSILGLVMDGLGNPVPEAEVQLVGANKAGLTLANGGFLFRPLALGKYMIRVRKLGYSPAVMTINLISGDDREVVIRMDRLPVELDPIVSSDRSGYGFRDQQVYEDLERRMRWHNFQTVVLGPDELKRYYGSPLDFAAKAMGVTAREQGGRTVVRSIMSGPQRLPKATPSEFGDACILLNGKTSLKQPLSTFTTDDIEFLEVYPPGTDLTGTVGDRMTHQGCKPGGRGRHPTYWVLWLKGEKR
jgi:hypothetical protein